MENFPFAFAQPHGYVGRFAPSPSGHLHFGSMVAAIASYVQARANNGLWLVRMEDIDPPREMPGAASHILKTLEQHGLQWDGEVLYQSQRSQHYQIVLQWLQRNGLSYHCQCTRKQINLDSRYPGIYQRRCRDLNLPSHHCAVRFKNDQPIMSFTDALQGEICADPKPEFADDFIIHRKDGLFAYQLAVVVDDIFQGITEVVRGSDLLSTTLTQMTLYQAFGHSPINYLHLPVAVTEPGKKLSKQNHAQPVEPSRCQQTLFNVLKFLALQPPADLSDETPENILNWAIEHWQIQHLPACGEIVL